MNLSFGTSKFVLLFISPFFISNLYLNIKPCLALQSKKMRPDAKTWRPSLPHLMFCHFLFLVLISQSAVWYLPGIDLVTQLIYQKTDALQEPRSFAACHTLWCPCLRFLRLLVLKGSDEESKLRRRWSQIIIFLENRATDALGIALCSHV